MGDELPVLIAAVTTQKARELFETAQVGGDVWVPLEQGPTRDGAHVLEVYTAEADTPVRLLAEPLGMGDERGSALRLHPWKKPNSERRVLLANGRFELLSLLGKGSIGAVYRARNTMLKNVVAVKVLHEAFQRDAEFCRRFYAEALAMSRLNHANLISVLDFGQEPDGLLYIAMECVEGGSLRAIQQKERRFALSRIVALMLQMCAGLGHAHGKGLIHRDVKPDNLMIVTKEDDDGQQVETVKVLDFGFAVPGSVSGEVAERLAGTPVYMSPEQCRGEELDARSDVYACGIMMYELVTGSPPFLAHDSATLRQMHIQNPAPPLGAEPRFDRIVAKALAKNREHRHANMAELRMELKALLAKPQQAAVPDEPPPSSRRMTPAAVSPPREPAPEDDWLERGSGHMISSQASLAETLAKDPRAWLGELARERNPKTFLRKVEELESAVRTLAQRGDAKTLARISPVVSGLEIHDNAGRIALAAVARLFADPDLLTPIAMRVLQQDSPAGVELLVQARVSGAIALYGARTKLAQPAARVAFVTTMKSLGPSARPVIKQALERLYEQSSQHRAAAELAEDVLLSVPKGDDEAAGQLVLRFGRSPLPSLVRAATRALPRVWGPNARPVLVHLLAHEDDSVCLAAVIGLHELDAIDLEAVARIAAQIEAGRARSQQLGAAFVTALRSATASAQAEATSILARFQR